MTTWRICPWCPPEDNSWPEEAFGAAGNAYAYGDPPCSACWEERYPRRRVRCVGCSKSMQTRGRGPAKCRACRDAEAGPVPPVGTCARCRCKGVLMHTHRTCNACHCRRQRELRGQRDKQRAKDA